MSNHSENRLLYTILGNIWGNSSKKPLAVLSYSFIKFEGLWQGNTSLPEGKKCETGL